MSAAYRRRPVPASVAHVSEGPELLAEIEAALPECWWWISFADDDSFLGVAIVRGRGFLSALRRTLVLGINPGGSVQATPLSAGDYVPDEFRDRLLDDAAVERLGKVTVN